MISEKTLDEIDELNEKDALKKIEAVLFISGRFLTMPELVAYTDINPIIIRESIRSIKKRYNDDSSIEIVEKTGETEFRIVEGSNEHIQLESLLAKFALVGNKLK